MAGMFNRVEGKNNHKNSFPSNRCIMIELIQHCVGSLAGMRIVRSKSSCCLKLIRIRSQIFSPRPFPATWREKQSQEYLPFMSLAMWESSIPKPFAAQNWAEYPARSPGECIRPWREKTITTVFSLHDVPSLNSSRLGLAHSRCGNPRFQSLLLLSTDQNTCKRSWGKYLTSGGKYSTSEGKNGFFPPMSNTFPQIQK